MTYPCETPPVGIAAQMAGKFTVPVPSLHTDRLVLRASALAGFPSYADIVCSQRGQYIGGPISREDAWDYDGFHAFRHTKGAMS